MTRPDLVHYGPTTPAARWIRDLGTRCRNWSAIARQAGTTLETVTMVLTSAWSWHHTTCQHCHAPMSYRIHVDHPRHYGRCAHCAARAYSTKESSRP